MKDWKWNSRKEGESDKTNADQDHVTCTRSYQ